MSEDSNKNDVNGSKFNKATLKNQNYSNDLISVRDIYLILRRGLPLIIFVGLFVAALPFVYFSLKKDIFEAAATAVVSPSGLDIRNSNGISFSPQTAPSFETYKSLANSDQVISSVLEVVKEQFPDLYIDAQAFKGRSVVDKIYGPLSNRPDTADRVTLALSQKVKHENADFAVALTNVWTEKTIETVQETLSGSLNSISGLTKTSFLTAHKNLEDAQEALKQASSEGALDVLDAQVLTAGQHIADQNVRLSEAKTELEVARKLQRILLGKATSTLSEASRQLVVLQLQNAEADFEKAYAELKEFEGKYDLITLEARSIFLSLQLAKLEQLLIMAKTSTDGQVQAAKRSELSELNDELLQKALLDNQSLSEYEVILQSDIADENGFSVEKNSTFSELRNYLSYQNLDSSSTIYSVEDLQQAIQALKFDLDAISSQFGPLKLEEDRLRLNYDSAEQRLSNILAERSRILSENEALLIALEAEVLTLVEQININEEALLALQSKRAEAQRTIGTLIIEVEAAADVYREIAGLEPTIAYLTQLSPLSAQVINLASTSLDPIGTGRSLPTVLAFLVTVIIMIILVFFREAIKQ